MNRRDFIRMLAALPFAGAAAQIPKVSKNNYVAEYNQYCKEIMVAQSMLANVADWSYYRFKNRENRDL